MRPKPNSGAIHLSSEHSHQLLDMVGILVGILLGRRKECPVSAPLALFARVK